VPRRRLANGPIQNGPRRLKQIKALHWQTPARGSFYHQRLFGALANRMAEVSARQCQLARNGNKRRQCGSDESAEEKAGDCSWPQSV
jgi:hypothetical protein